MSTKDEQDREDLAGRLPSLEEQTPGLDDQQVRRTDDDAVAYYSRGTEQGETQGLDEMADAAGRGAGTDEGRPPAGDVRTVYENERQPGEAKPQGAER